MTGLNHHLIRTALWTVHPWCVPKGLGAPSSKAPLRPQQHSLLSPAAKETGMSPQESEHMSDRAISTSRRDSISPSSPAPANIWSPTCLRCWKICFKKSSSLLWVMREEEEMTPGEMIQLKGELKQMKTGRRMEAALGAPLLQRSSAKCGRNLEDSISLSHKLPHFQILLSVSPMQNVKNLHGNWM